MNFASCNRLLLQKELQSNTKHHKQKLQHIRRSVRQHKSDKKLHSRKYSIVDLPKSQLKTQKQAQISKNNTIILDKITTFVKKDNNLETQYIKPRKTKYSHKFARQPNINQKSEYSIDKLNKQWKTHCDYFQLVSKSKKDSTSKQPSNQLSTFSDSSHKLFFDNSLKLFQQLNLEEPIQGKFLKPQNLAERVIIHKRSVIFDEVPFLIEISTAYKKVFIIAYCMSSNKGKITRLIMSEHKSRRIFEIYNYDFNLILQKIVIEDQRIIIKNSLKQSRKTNYILEDKPDIEKQSQFIRRNYYELIERYKKNHNQNVQCQQAKSKSGVRKQFSSSGLEKASSNLTTLSKIIKHSHRGKRLSMASTLKKFVRSDRFNQTQQVQQNSDGQQKAQKMIQKVGGPLVREIVRNKTFSSRDNLKFFKGKNNVEQQLKYQFQAQQTSSKKKKSVINQQQEIVPYQMNVQS